MRRLAATGLVGILVVSVLAGCSPAVRGLSGIRLDTEDGLVAVFGLCSDFGDLTTITLYGVEPDGHLGAPIATLERTTPVSDRYLEVPLSRPPAGWRVDGVAPSGGDPAKVYELRAWNEDGGNRVASFPFHVSELVADPDPGSTILTRIFTRSTEGTGRYESAVLSAEGFRQAAQEGCDRG